MNATAILEELRRAELDRRVSESEANPDDGLTWEQVEA